MGHACQSRRKNMVLPIRQKSARLIVPPAVVWGSVVFAAVSAACGTSSTGPSVPYTSIGASSGGAGPPPSGGGGASGSPGGGSGSIGGQSGATSSSGSGVPSSGASSGTGEASGSKSSGSADGGGSSGAADAAPPCTKTVTPSMDCSAPLAPGDQKYCTLGTRKYYIYAPKTFDVCKPAALVIDAHGATQTAQSQFL